MVFVEMTIPQIAEWVFSLQCDFNLHFIFNFQLSIVKNRHLKNENIKEINLWTEIAFIKTIIASKKIKTKRDYVLFKDYVCFKRDMYD